MSKEKLAPLALGIFVAIVVALVASLGIFFGFEAMLGDSLISPK